MVTTKEVFWDKWKNPLVREEESDEDSEFKSPTKNNIPILVGPFGVLPIGENTDIAKVFNFWILHTNFDITDDIFSAIEKVPGVESLDLQSRTRYRCRVGIGKVFDEDDVKESIEKKIGVIK